jgi:hypothetical protein
VHTLEVARLVTDWHGQGPIDLPGVRARRAGGRIEFSARGSDGRGRRDEGENTRGDV